MGVDVLDAALRLPPGHQPLLPGPREGARPPAIGHGISCPAARIVPPGESGALRRGSCPPARVVACGERGALRREWCRFRGLGGSGALPHGVKSLRTRLNVAEGRIAAAAFWRSGA